MALISLTRAKEYLPNFNSSDDTILTDILNAASDLVERYLNRNILSASYDELYHGNGYRTLRLNQYPVTAIARVATGPTTVLNISNTDTANSRATVQVTSSGLTLTRVASGVTTTGTVTFASNVTVQAVATAVSALGGGWTATALEPYTTWASADLRALQGSLNAARSRLAGLVVHVEELSEFRINEAIGELIVPGGFTRGRQNYRVLYTAGYSSVPEPIQQAIAELASVVYRGRNINGNLQSESLGQYSYTKGPFASSTDPFAALSAIGKTGLSLYKSWRIPDWEI